MAYTFLQAAIEVLWDSPTPLKVFDIWDKILQKGLDKKIGSTGATPEHTLAAQLYTSVKKENSPFISISKRPRLFGLRDKSYQHTPSEIVKIEDKESQSAESKEEKASFHERDLHPLFVKFANESELNLLCKTIYHEESKKDKKGRDKWIYPDIVGVRFAFSDFREEETLILLNKLEYPKAQLYSFELKKNLGWHNLKESYFQAVSNSSWADYGYLAVFGSIESEILEELNKLNSRFGIGVITFGTRLEEFEIKIYAEHKDEPDLSVIDELIGKNENFKHFIENVIADIDVERSRISKSLYDEIKTDEKLEHYMRQKKIEGF